jgi:hypothetical protein
MEFPKLYTVIWRDEKEKNQFFFTDNADLAFKKEALNDGTTYIDNRYRAKRRLYFYLLRKQLYSNE